MNKEDQLSPDVQEALEPLNDRVIQILLENHWQFRSFLAKRVRSEELADDLFQLSLKKALESSTAPALDASIVRWFYRVLKNTLIDHYRSLSAEERKNDAFIQSLVSEGQAHVPSRDEIEAAVCQCLEGLLPTLRPNYADLIRRVDLNGESAAAVAESLSITENNLNVRLHRARQALKVSLERTCGTCTEHGCLSCTCE